jgi:hypothetical protein
MFPHLVPLLPVQIATEQEIKETNPREEGDKTLRVLVHYTNHSGNSILFQVVDGLGLNRSFDIDDFLVGYASSIGDDLKQLGGNETASMQFTTISAFCYALGIVLNIEKDTTRGRLKNLCTNVFSSIASCLYDDSLDVMVMCRDGKPREDGERQVVVTNMWSMTKP